MTAKKSPHAAAAYFGYSLQTRRCLVCLLESPPNTSVSVEVFEDVGIEYADGTKVASQSKATVQNGNPVADRSPDLWKTFSNWIDAVRSGELDAEQTIFEIYLNTPKSGSFIEKFHSATTNESALSALADARLEFWGDAPQYAKRAGLATSLAPYIDNVLSCDPTVSAAIVQRFRYTAGTGSSSDDLTACMAKCVPPDVVEDAVNYALGWVSNRIDELIEKNLPATIAVDVFRERLWALIRRTDPGRVLRCFAATPNDEEIASELAVRTYVKQLQIIDCDYEDQVDAVIDYFRAATNRTVWSARGFVGEDDLLKYEETLTKTWKHISRKAKAIANTDDSARGRSSYSECMLYRCTMDGLSLPDGFVPGCYHSLAEALTVGWHPNFKSILSK